MMRLLFFSLLIILIPSIKSVENNSSTNSSNSNHVTQTDSNSRRVLVNHPCTRMPNPFELRQNLVANQYNATTELWMLDFTDLFYKFCDDSIYTNVSDVVSIRVELIATQRKKLKNSQMCRVLDSTSSLQAASHLSPSNALTLFQFVQGRYFVRLSTCGATQGCQLVACSHVVKLKPEVKKDDEVCQKDPMNVTQVRVRNASRVLDFQSCSVALETVVPLCTRHQAYHRARVFAFEADVDSECSIDTFFTARQLFNATVKVDSCRDGLLCNNSLQGHELDPGLISHSLRDLSRNASFCVFYQIDNPHCVSANDNGLSCLFFTGKLTCSRVRLNPLALLTEPMFIGVVSLTLFLSLTLLMWTVIQCSRKRPQTPIQQPIKKPPRSLTEDDLEHISRLPSQEIVLVYFPDTQRFKELNRRLRSWLITLDVNDVKDIYDEKCSEEVLKDPERWVKEALGGPEKRIILVCSRLAYECLITVKKGISSPKFVETDPHFGLLTRAIQYLDREMRGNYRNLICVRYEDIKVCDRKYSSEAFNIVPGTEYVLPQHLEDVYRWIHPRDPKPECWSEARQEVRELLDFMRKYRLHDDNGFTVQFPNGAVEVSPKEESKRLLDSNC